MIPVHIISTKNGINGKGGIVGKLALLRCNTCLEEFWKPYSVIKDGGGKFCSRKCYAENQRTRIGEQVNSWKGGHNKKEITKRWQRNNKERYYFLLRRRGYLKKNAEGSHTFKEWEQLKRVCHYQCVCCEKKEPKIKLTEDHIIPLSKGGNNYIANIQPLCHSCNSKKNNKTINYLDEYIKKFL